MENKSDYKAKIKERLKEINFAYGINEKDVFVLAQNYLVDRIDEGKGFLKKIVVTKPVFLKEWESSDNWAVVFPIKRGLGLIGPKEYVLFVNKKTGEVKPGGEKK